METRLEIEGTKITPTVSFNVEENFFKLEGRSLASNATAFYDPICLWLEENSRNKKIDFQIELEYFNTSSHKHLLKLFKVIKSLNSESIIIWKYDEDDDEMLDIGKKMEILTSLIFKFVIIED